MTLSGKVKSKHLVAVSLACVVYLSYMGGRKTLLDTDLHRVVEEFAIPVMSIFTMREPLYWGAGKALSSILADPWSAVIALDILAFFCLFTSTGRKIPGALFLFALLISPMFLLGINNIHRQFVGFCVWMLVESKFDIFKSKRTAFFHIIPFLIHTSLGLMSLSYYVAFAPKRQRWMAVAAIGFAIISIYFVFPSSFSIFLRYGTDTNTSMFLYSIWASILFLPVLVATGPLSRISKFYLLSFLFALLLFQSSGGSSGSRFFLMFTTAAVLMLSRPAASRLQDSLSRLYVNSAMYCLLTAPSFFNTYSLNLLLSAKTYATSWISL